jgi:4-amino-4-deoxy-L-arabinose transferase-like glycosyltransferase
MKDARFLLFIISAGIIIGYMWILFPGALFMLSLFGLFSMLLWHFSAAEDKKFVTAIFIIGVCSRVIVYSFLAFISVQLGKSGWLIGDSWGHHNYALVFMQRMAGNMKSAYMWAQEGHAFLVFEGVDLERAWQYGYNGLTYLLGIIYYFFGALKFSGRFINFFMAAGSAIFIYYITKDIFGRRTARLSAMLTIFVPSMFLWSLTFLKDIPFIFTTCATLWCFLKWQKTKRLSYIFIALPIIFFQYTIRPTFPIILLVFVLGLSAFITSGMSTSKKIVILTCLLLVAVVLYGDKVRLQDVITMNLNYSRGVINTGGSTYKIFAPEYYAGGYLSDSSQISTFDFAKGFFKGWLYFLLMPFPWMIGTRLQLVSFPQTVLWYFILPFIFVGMLVALRHNWKDSCVIFIYIVVYGSMISLTSGNIGTAFRHRDILTPLFLIFAAVGLIKALGRLDIVENDEASNP